MIMIWDKQGNLTLNLKGHQELVNSVVFSQGWQLYSQLGPVMEIARLWNRQGQELKVLRGHQDPVYDVALNGQGDTVSHRFE